VIVLKITAFLKFLNIKLVISDPLDDKHKNYMSDHEDGWYLLAEHENIGDVGCDALFDDYDIYVEQKFDEPNDFNQTFPGPNTLN